MLNKKLQNAVTNNGTNLLHEKYRRFVFGKFSTGKKLPGFSVKKTFLYFL